MPTFSFFNFLFWDNTQQLNKEEKDHILHHEQKHIWDRHSYDVIFLEIAKIIWWFNPIIYLIYKDLRMQHEYLADASVLRESSIKKYAKTLVKIVFQHNNLPLAHSFNQQEIKNRLLVMQEHEKWQELDILTESNINSFQKPKDFYAVLFGSAKYSYGSLRNSQENCLRAQYSSYTKTCITQLAYKLA
jgi:hypothetical protein